MVKEASDLNHKMRSDQLRKETMQQFVDKKDMSKFSKYLTEKDEMAALSM